MKNNGPVNTNVLLVGKTGVGKSSLINYLYDRPGMVPTGSGKPVTPFGIHPIAPFMYNSLLVSPFDSSGFEGGEQIAAWRDNLASELKKNSLGSVKDWFHTVIYCISVEGERLDPYEVKLIREIIDEGNRVIFALTKCDTVDEARLDQMRHLVTEEFGSFPLVRICSVELKRRGGKISRPFGRQLLFQTICRNFRSNLIEKMVASERRQAEKYIGEFHRQVMDDFDQSVSVFSLIFKGKDTFREKSRNLEENYRQLISRITQSIAGTLEEVNEISAQIMLSYMNIDAEVCLSQLELKDGSSLEAWEKGAEKSFADFARLIFSPSASKTKFHAELASRLMELKKRLRGNLDEIFEKIRRADSTALLLPDKS
ncbi:MAG: hypothetical protein IJ523_02070 [Succinivibrionaceae bacterium]|nr:hypothetical protein [Succinivibrionaceae bacterium]